MNETRKSKLRKTRKIYDALGLQEPPQSICVWENIAEISHIEDYMRKDFDVWFKYIDKVEQKALEQDWESEPYKSFDACTLCIGVHFALIITPEEKFDMIHSVLCGSEEEK